MGNFQSCSGKKGQPNMLKNSFEILIGLTQRYCTNLHRAILKICGFLKGIEQDNLVEIFLNGLKEEINRSEVI